MNTATGEVISQRIRRNDSAAFTEFLSMLDQHTAPGLRIHLIMDNGSSHTSKATRAWIAAHPRFTVTHAPEEEEDLYPRRELVEMFRQTEQLLAEMQGRPLELETLEPDGNGNLRGAPRYADSIAGSEPGDDDRDGEPEDRRQVVFINSRGLFSAGR